VILPRREGSPIVPEFNYPDQPDPDEPADSGETLPSPATDSSDSRLYVHSPEGWQARIKQGWEKQYCYSRFPGQDHFHLILNGEIFLEHNDEKLCLSCAVRRGVITTDRLFWQRKPRRAAPRQV
jgi:hypothetical protein